jgi:hypothetical protein
MDTVTESAELLLIWLKKAELGLHKKYDIEQQAAKCDRRGIWNDHRSCNATFEFNG